MTSESTYGIVEQPAETCPVIDKAVRSVDVIRKIIKGYEKADEAELRDMISSIEGKLDDLNGRYSWAGGLLEDIRKANIAIRAWGQEWKDLAKKHAPQPEEQAA